MQLGIHCLSLYRELNRRLTCSFFLENRQFGLGVVFFSFLFCYGYSKVHSGFFFFFFSKKLVVGFFM